MNFLVLQVRSMSGAMISIEIGSVVAYHERTNPTSTIVYLRGGHTFDLQCTSSQFFNDVVDLIKKGRRGVAVIATLIESLIFTAISVALTYLLANWVLSMTFPHESVSLWWMMTVGALIFLRDLYSA